MAELKYKGLQINTQCQRIGTADKWAIRIIVTGEKGSRKNYSFPEFSGTDPTTITQTYLIKVMDLIDNTPNHLDANSLQDFGSKTRTNVG